MRAHTMVIAQEPVWITFVLIFPYWFFILLGQIVFFTVLIKKLLNRSLTVRITGIKLVCSLYGAIGGFLILLTYEVYKPKVLAGPFWGDYPAALLSGFFEDISPIVEGLVWLNWQHLIPFILFGLLGGWGLGQLVDGVMGLIRKRK